MIAILKNNFYRLLTKRSLIITMMIMTIGAIAAAIFFSTKTETVANIAIVSSAPVEALDLPTLKITTLKEVPPMSQMVSGSYDAVLIQQSDGSFEIETIKSKETKDAIMQLLETGTTPESYHAEKRGVGMMIIGYLLMFLLMESVTLMFVYAEDKEHKQISRVISAPISLGRYLSAHYIFSFTALYLTTMIILSIIKLVSRLDLGFTFLQYAALIALICAIATAFSMFINSLTNKSDNANMAASAIIVMTSVLAGSFFSFGKGNALLERIINILPQKAYLNIVEQVEKGADITSYTAYLFYLGILMVFFLVFAVIKTKKDYVQSH